MLYPTRVKKITVDWSKVLKIDCIDCSVISGPPGIYYLYGQVRRNTLSFGGAKSRRGHICLRFLARERSDRAGGGGGCRRGDTPSHGRDFKKMRV